jgi:hypothetical protein
MSNLHDTINELLEENGMPHNISNRLLMAILLEIRIAVNANTVMQIDHEKRIAEEERAVNPSLTWLLKNRPAPTIKTAAIILIVLMLLMTIGQPIAAFVAALLGLPIP